MRKVSITWFLCLSIPGLLLPFHTTTTTTTMTTPRGDDSEYALALNQCVCVCVCARARFYCYDYYCSFENYISSFISCGARFRRNISCYETGSRLFFLVSDAASGSVPTALVTWDEQYVWRWHPKTWSVQSGHSLAANNFALKWNRWAIFTRFDVVGSVTVGRPLY